MSCSNMKLPVDMENVPQESSRHEKEFVSWNLLTGHWEFNDTGRYAATIEQYKHESQHGRAAEASVGHQFGGGRIQHRIVIYDCLEKTAYEYMYEFTDIWLDWFYWFGDYLVIVDKSRNKKSYSYELNHEERCARMVHEREIKNEDHLKYFFSNYQETKSVVSIDNIEYFALLNIVGSLLLLPKDPFSTIKPKLYLIDTPFTGYRGIVNDVEGLYELHDEPMSYQSSIFCFKRFSVSPFPTFLLDVLIKIDLTKLQDVYGKEIDKDLVIAEQDLSAYSEVKLKYDNVVGGNLQLYRTNIVYGSCLQTAQGYKHVLRLLNGYGSYLGRHILDHSFIIDLKTMEAREFKRRNCAMHDWYASECFHPSGQLLDIFYEGEPTLKCELKLNMDEKPRTLKEIAKRNIFYGKKSVNWSEHAKIIERFL